MPTSKCLSLLFLFSNIAMVSHAQISFPKFDIDVKGSGTFVTADKSIDPAYYADGGMNFNLQGGAHWQLNQNIGIGWMYSRSLTGSMTYGSNNNSGTPSSSYNTFMLMNGPDIRISTGRIKDWRPYLSLNYLTVEYVEDHGGYRLAQKTNSFGVGIGIMRKLGNKLYWNVLEANGHLLSENIFWLTNSDLILEAKTGFTYNFGKQK